MPGIAFRIDFHDEKLLALGVTQYINAEYGNFRKSRMLLLGEGNDFKVVPYAPCAAKLLAVRQLLSDRLRFPQARASARDDALRMPVSHAQQEVAPHEQDHVELACTDPAPISAGMVARYGRETRNQKLDWAWVNPSPRRARRGRWPSEARPGGGKRSE
jgi:hypothetical protein